MANAKKTASKKKSSKKKKKKGVIKVDFTGVEGRKHIPEGDYFALIAEFEEKEGDDYPYISWKFEIESDDAANGGIVYTNTSLAPKALFNLRNMLESMGYEVPDSAMELDLNGMVGERVAFQIVHEEYEGKPRPKVADWLPVEDETEGEGEDEPELEGEGEGEEEEAPTEEDINGMSSDDLAELVESYELDLDLGDYKTIRKKRKVIIEALIEAEVIEADD